MALTTTTAAINAITIDSETATKKFSSPKRNVTTTLMMPHYIKRASEREIQPRDVFLPMFALVTANAMHGKNSIVEFFNVEKI